MKHMQWRGLTRAGRLWPLAAVSAAAALTLAACGGGSSGGTSGDNSGPSGAMQVRLVDGPAMDYTNVWITVKEVWVHKLDTADASSSGWAKLTLPAPVTLDLNQLSNGAMSGVLGSLNLPVGTYRQIRLVLAGSDDALTSSAQAQSPALQYNDQVNYVDAFGQPQVAPLEIAQATQGIALVGTFNVTAGGTLNLAVEFDIGDDIVRFKHDGLDAFTMTPVLRYYDLDQSGAIVGKIDKIACGTLPANPCGAFVVKAEELSADASYHRVARWTSVRPDGSFTLFPVPAGAGKTYDLMLRGRNAQTMIVRNVPVTSGTMPGSSPTSVSFSALQMSSAPEFTVNWATPSDPTSVYTQFYQTVGGGVPYEIRTNVMNPFTGRFLDDYPLTDGTVRVGNYVAGGDPVFGAFTPAEGPGGYRAVVSGWGIARADAGIVSNGGAGVTVQMPTPVLQPAARVAALGSIGGSIVQNTAARFDRGFLVVMRGGAIVNTQDISALLQSNGGTGGSYSIGGLPAGSGVQPLGSNGNGVGIYYAYLRVWNSAHPLLTTRLVPMPGMANLDTTSSATLNVTLP